ncbi:hypothetical protein EV424DRAFT_1346993 [Suillus variegatus]|nr:hypothetical protein EV424DRAFT_1346993 [Suillus variegatus]
MDGWADRGVLHIWTYRVPNSGHLNPETRDCRVLGIGCPELRTWENLGRSIQFDSQSNIPSSEFRTPDTRDPAVSGFGVRVSGTRNSDSGFRDSALPKPGS